MNPKNPGRKLSLLPLGIALLLSMSVATVAVSQEVEHPEGADSTSVAPMPHDVIEMETVVLGSRAKPRSVADSAVPIDVVQVKDLVKQGGKDLQDIVRNVVPSYNVNAQPLSDAATVVRPPNMRGLAPDHTLVLVNGKRRHRASVIYWLGNGIADGSQGPDIAAIPAIALKRVEVLRDGASAQYGSDAIAGVLNFQLKDSHKKGSLEIKPGIFQEGDGLTYALAGNIGLGRRSAWANLSLEYGNTDETDRAIQRVDAIALIAAGNMDVADPAMIWGQPFVRDDLKFFANYGADIYNDIKFYGHANFASKEVEGGFYFRNPNTRPAVFSNDEGKTLLVGDLDVPEGEEPEVPVVTITDNAPDPVALQQVFDDPNLFTFQELFPGGFTPRFGAETVDRSLLVGLKRTFAELFALDLSAYHGRHASDFFIFNTVNASLGPDTPTFFDPGDYIQTDTNINLDATYPVNEQLSLAAGLEYRTEQFEVVAGQKESFEIGPLASQGFSSGSNGFNGFSNLSAGVWDRSNQAAYIEAELTPLDNWLLAAALRHENFDDFGVTTNYKLATNYGLTDELKVRGSYSTGFRAPTPGQQNTFNVTTEFGEDSKGNFILVNKGTIPSTHPAAAVVGGEALEPETSKNFSLGTIVSNDALNLTIDYFNIKVEDRVATSSDQQLTPEQVEALFAAGIAEARNLQEFRFFTNDFETETQGIDVVLTAPVSTGGLSLAYNYTGTEVTRYNPEQLDDERITLLEKGLPRHRWNISLTQALAQNWDILGRVNYYDFWDEQSIGHQVFGSSFLLDLESTLSLAAESTVTLGVQNFLSVEPDNYSVVEGGDPAEIVGRPFGEYSPFGFGGAFWYAKYSYTFEL